MCHKYHWKGPFGQTAQLILQRNIRGSRTQRELATYRLDHVQVAHRFLGAIRKVVEDARAASKRLKSQLAIKGKPEERHAFGHGAELDTTDRRYKLLLWVRGKPLTCTVAFKHELKASNWIPENLWSDEKRHELSKLINCVRRTETVMASLR